MPVKDLFLTSSFVAEKLGVSPQTIHKYCEEGVFPGAFKLGDGRTSPWRIPQKSFEAYLKQRGQAAKAS